MLEYGFLLLGLFVLLSHELQVLAYDSILILSSSFVMAFWWHMRLFMGCTCDVNSFWCRIGLGLLGLEEGLRSLLWH